MVLFAICWDMAIGGHLQPPAVCPLTQSRLFFDANQVLSPSPSWKQRFCLVLAAYCPFVCTHLRPMSGLFLGLSPYLRFFLSVLFMEEILFG